MSRKLMYLIAVVSLLFLAMTRTTGAQEPGLAGWWKLDETSGETASDSSGHKHKGTAKGGTDLNFGSHGLKAVEPERITARQIGSSRAIVA